MQRYFVQADLKEKSTWKADDEVYHHAVRVMRMKLGETVYLVDANSHTFIGTVEEIEEGILSFAVKETQHPTVELPIRVMIAAGLSKGDKFEQIVQKATELGVSEIIPLKTNRDVVKWSTDKEVKKIERLQKIAKEAAEQSHRTIVPIVHQSVSIKELKKWIDRADTSLVAYEESARQKESSLFARTLKELPTHATLLMIFGSEGGFDAQEIHYLKELGVESCGLGPRILRAETAPLYALSAISFSVELQ